MTTIILLLLKVSGEPIHASSSVFSFNQQGLWKKTIATQSKLNRSESLNRLVPSIPATDPSQRVSQWSWALFMPSVMTALEHSKIL